MHGGIRGGAGGGCRRMDSRHYRKGENNPRSDHVHESCPLHEVACIYLYQHSCALMYTNAGDTGVTVARFCAGTIACTYLEYETSVFAFPLHSVRRI